LAPWRDLSAANRPYGRIGFPALRGIAAACLRQVVLIVMDRRKTLLGALKEGLRRISPNCRETSRLQSESIDHLLTWPQRLGLRVHLLLCKWCRRYGKQIHFLRRASHEYPDQVTGVAPSTLSPESRERLKRALRDQAK
jgi:hypothetical protein